MDEEKRLRQEFFYYHNAREAIPERQEQMDDAMDTGADIYALYNG
jgi:hypothetical protein